MKRENMMKVSFPSRSSNEALARMVVSAFVAGLDPVVEELCDIKTAVSEAVTNCIVHAYPDSLGDIYITAVSCGDRRIVIKVKDHGCGIADIAQAMTPTFTTDTGGERAGLGFAVMQELMDSVRVRSRVGKGTTVILERRLRARE